MKTHNLLYEPLIFMLLELINFIYTLPSTSLMYYQLMPSSNTEVNQSLTSYNIFLSVKLMSIADGTNIPPAVPTNGPCKSQ
jgi:hypothetical protein